ncbi:MAG: D-Ala-D-Ala transporter [Rhodobacteraceae bacterium]|jgi:peptide/nickel transport system permease protein|nr:D-Ala-D-Ala transporter [Paracoccaceae bacterium]MBT4284072.1 ABC transporter permease [Paracoccaceae bacterium]|tara:strand:+ start:7911 stop:8915 length:1005 start_codon:yes stop_codon:yes gene_type:complete
MRILYLIFNRLVWFFPTVFGLLLLVFTISHIIPADPVAFLAGDNATNEQIADLRAQYGFDKPLYIQFINYVLGTFQGDLGISLYTQRPISDDLLGRLPATLELTFVSVLISALLGVPLGVIAAVYRNSIADHILRLITVSGLAIASFWLAILFQLFFAMELQWTPLQGRIDGWGPDHITGFFLIDSLLVGDWESFGSAFSHLVLPVATLAFPAMATIMRFTRAGVLDAINSNYVLYEQAMGFPERIIIWKYILRNALIGTVTQIGLIFGLLLAGTVVVEAVFDWPGLGLYAVQSIMNSDYNAIMGFTLITGTMFILINLLVDVLQGVMDPRSEL